VDGGWTLEPVEGDPFAAPPPAAATAATAPSWSFQPVDGDPFAQEEHPTNGRKPPLASLDTGQDAGRPASTSPSLGTTGDAYIDALMGKNAPDNGELGPPDRAKEPLPEGYVGEGRPYQPGWSSNSFFDPDRPTRFTPIGEPVVPGRKSPPAALDKGTPIGERVSAVDEWGNPVDNGPPRYQDLADIPGYINEAGQAVTATGAAISGFGDVARYGPLQGASHLLSVMNAIDQGDDPQVAMRQLSTPERFMLGQYPGLSPEDRKAFRSQLQSGMAEAVAAPPNAAQRLGSKIEEYGKRTFPLPEDPTFGQKVVGGVSSMIPMVAAGMIGGTLGGPGGAMAATLPVIGAQSYHDTLSEALSKGMTPTDASRAAGVSALTQMGIMALPIGRAIEMTPSLAPGLLNALLDLSKRGAEFGSFNALATFAGNFVDRATGIDPDRSLMQGVPEAAAVGIVTGAGMGVPGATHTVPHLADRLFEPFPPTASDRFRDNVLGTQQAATPAFNAVDLQPGAGVPATVTGPLADAITAQMRYAGLPPSVGVKLVNQIAGGDADSSYARGVVTVAMDTPPDQVPIKVHHETIHALLDPDLGLLNDQDRQTLYRAADNWLNVIDPGETVPRRRLLADMYGVGPASSIVREEGVARMSEAALLNGMTPRSPIGAAAAKIGNFVTSLGQGLRGQGFRTADDVFNGLMGGDRAEPAAEAGGTSSYAPPQPVAPPSAARPPSPATPPPEGEAGAPTPAGRVTIAQVQRRDGVGAVEAQRRAAEENAKRSGSPQTTEPALEPLAEDPAAIERELISGLPPLPPKMATTPEPQADIEAQIRAMTDPNNPKDTVFLARGTAVPESANAPGVLAYERPEGTLLTTDVRKARTFADARSVDDTLMARLLGYPETKSDVLATGAPHVVQGRDAAGNVVVETLASPAGLPAAEEMARAQAPVVEVVTPDAAQAERTEKVAAEAAPAGAALAENPIVEHVTKKGKTLRGTIRTDLTRDEAKAIDPYSFRKGDGFFIREGAEAQTQKSEAEIPVNANRPPEAPPTPETAETKPTDLPSPALKQADLNAAVWHEIGFNRNGHPLFEDARGVRSYVENGVRSTETVRLRPGSREPIVAAPEAKDPDYQVAVWKPATSSTTGRPVWPPRRPEYNPAQAAAPTADEVHAVIVRRLQANDRLITVLRGHGDGAPALATLRRAYGQESARFMSALADAGGDELRRYSAAIMENERRPLDMDVLNEVRGQPEAQPQTPPAPSAAAPPSARPQRVEAPPPGSDNDPLLANNIERWLREGQPPDKLMANAVAAMLAEGDLRSAGEDRSLATKRLQASAELIYGGKLGEGKFTRDRFYDAIEAGVNRYIANNPDRFAPTGTLARAQAVAESLREIKDRLPTQTVRAGDKDKLQQFSTPPDYSFATAWIANMRPSDRVLEPSAGNGGLAVHAMNAGVAEVVGNEISPQRRAMMQNLPFSRITGENAEQLHHILTDEVRPSVVIMNPPFSSAGDRLGGKMDTRIGAQHIDQALARLEPGGRLVAIVGRGMGMNAPTFRDWWKRIGMQYDVRANVAVDGSIYRKYGTTFGTRVLVIDKIAPTGRPIVEGEAKDAADLLNTLAGVHDDRPGSSSEPVGGQPTGAGLAEEGTGRPNGPEGGLRGPTGTVGPGGGRGVGETANRPIAADEGGPGGAGGAPDAGDRTRENAGGDGVPSLESGQEPAGELIAADANDTGRGQPGAGGAAGGGDHIRPDGSDQQLTPPNPGLVKAGVIVEDPVQGGELTESVYEPYRPQRLAIEGAREHPGALVQSAAMASVAPPMPKHALAISRRLIDEGALSIAQLESLVYAGDAHAQMLPAPPDAEVRFRRGFFIGDGTGVGKGREVAGIILDNWMNGRRRAVWVSETPALVNDAKRDWAGLGMDPSQILPLTKVKAADAIKHDGILFSSYDTLKSGVKIKPLDAAAIKVGAQVSVPARDGTRENGTVTGRYKDTWVVQTDAGVVRNYESKDLATRAATAQTRVKQIVDWLGKDFDGVIAFDESHNLGNSVSQKGARGSTDPAQKALAGIELQKQLPNARVVYVSATGATEVANLAYADRLGLWGRGTAFADRSDFLSKISQGGVAAMELVARDMKALGHYMARNLSYDGVEYDRIQHDLTPDQTIMYDKIAEAWQVVLRNFNNALEDTQAGGKGGRRSAVLSAFWGSHQRFFNQLITSLQMPSVLRAVERDIAEGRQAVLQLVNTNEAGQNRALDKARADPEGDIEELDMSPRDQLMELVKKAFPVEQFETYVDDAGKERVRPVVDSKGNPVLNREAVAAREMLLDDLGSLRVPDGPLEILTNHFGPDKVAEVTGRTQRVVRKPDENGQVRAVVEKRNADTNVVEANAFQNGIKRVLVFSQAGGTGRSYHADLSSPSADNRRSHYLVQPGWRADKAVQGFGRTHRTNQASAPIFHLVTTNLEGQKRFISSIARRLGQLGALTKGERRTGDQGMFGLQDNLESDEAHAALTQFYRDIHRGEIEGVSDKSILETMGLQLTDPMTGGLRADLPPMSQFLNRILSLPVGEQNRVFNAFSDRFRDVVDHAVEAGTLDAGTETYRADRIVKNTENTVYTDPTSGAETKHVALRTFSRNYPTEFEQLHRGEAARAGFQAPSFYIRNRRTGLVSAVVPTTYSKTGADGVTTNFYRLVSPTDWRYVETDRVAAAIRGNVRTAPTADRVDNLAEARKGWDDRVAATPEFRQSDLHLITGAVLPVWDRLKGSPKVYRLQTDDGERLLGRVIGNSDIESTLNNLGVEATKADFNLTETIGRVLDGATARLANGWTLKRSMVAGEWRIELKGPSSSDMGPLRQDGVFRERIGYDTRLFVPTGDRAAEVLERITERRPIASIDSGGRDAGTSETPMFSLRRRVATAFDGLKAPDVRRQIGLPSFSPDVMGKMRKTLDEVQWLLSPTSRGAAAKQTEAIMRRRTSMQARGSNQAIHALENFATAIERLKPDQQLAITHRVETGQPQPTPELQAAMTTLKRIQDQRLRMLQSIGKLKDVLNSDDYMGRIYSNYREWKAGEDAKSQTEAERIAVARGLGKSPVQGSGAFLKQRTFATLEEAMAAGLIPVTTNPIKMQILKIREMDRFYHGTRMADEMKDAGIANWVPANAEAEGAARGLGWVPLDDKVFRPRIPGGTVGAFGRLEPGNYWAPEEATTLFNNYVSRGIAGNSVIYDTLRTANNALNGLQLGLSGFHATFVTLDSAISSMALGLQQVSRGITGRDLGQKSRLTSIGQGLQNMAEGAAIPVATYRTVREGSAAKRAWLDPQGATPEMVKIVDMLNAGGGRISMDQFYRSNASGSFFKNLHDLKNPDGAFREAWQMAKDTPLTAPFKIAGRMIDTLNEPLMGQLVPRMKIGVFSMMARDFMERHPDATPEQVSDAMTKNWDSVENRLGQMTYDNVFWNKTLKDSAFLMTRSVGWNLGTIRELAGSGVDAAAAVRDMASGKAPEMTNRIAYAMAMPMLTALLGATVTYLLTGKGPESMLDYFYPRSGTGPENDPDRLSIPGYIKDVVAYYKAPVQTVLNKTSPLPNAMADIFHNQDYYGGIIYAPELNESRIVAYAQYMLNQALPFSVRAIMKNDRAGASMLAQSLAFFGIQPAPQSVTHPEKEEAWQLHQNVIGIRRRNREQGLIRLSP